MSSDTSNDGLKTDLQEIVEGVVAELLADEGILSTEFDPGDSMEELGLPSRRGLEFALRIEDQIEVRIPVTVNPFIDDNKRRTRTCEEIVELLQSLVGQ